MAESATFFEMVKLAKFVKLVYMAKLLDRTGWTSWIG